MLRKRWLPWQAARIELERRVLAVSYPQFTLHEEGTVKAYVRGTWNSNGGRTYEIVVRLGSGFPDAAPSVYITHPYPLYGHGHKAIHTYGTSHSMHTFASDQPCETKVCTVRPEAWEANWSIAKIINKTQLWLMAYEGHVASGKPLSDYLLDN